MNPDDTARAVKDGIIGAIEDLALLALIAWAVGSLVGRLFGWN